LPVASAFGVIGIIALFIYLNRPGPCDSIFEQTAPKIDTTIQFLKTNGQMVIGGDKVQELAESSQRVGILCKTCCIAQQSGKISAAQFQDCLNTTKSYETQVLQIASSVDSANSARQKGQGQLVSEKTQQATLATSAAANQAQKLDNSVTAFSTDSTPAPGASSAAAGPPAKAIVITETDGTTMWVYRDGLYLFDGADAIRLDSGQSVDFSKVKAVEVLGIDNSKATIRITLVGGKTIQGTVDDPNGASGHNDLGDVNVPRDLIKRVDIPR
jgi:hypothetical protein